MPQSGSGRAPFSRKRFGQHFLEPAWVAKVIRAIDPQPADLFVEIGPGRGALTRQLLQRAGGVTAFEIDRGLVADLEGSHPHLTVIEGDFLESGDVLARRPVSLLRVAGNLPYNISSPILFKLLELRDAGARFRDATLMLQHEVAERLAAPSGGREYGVLSILVQHVADIEVLMTLPAGAFRPAPKVRSALVRMRFREPRPSAADPALFTGLVRAIFTRRRKTLANALLAFQIRPGVTPADVLERSGLDGTRRPETLTIAELVQLADAFSAAAGAQGSIATRRT
jgi:16S rRNA (adenine1518-N6/adenine1519-N6)-dimethyltransferase